MSKWVTSLTGKGNIKWTIKMHFPITLLLSVLHIDLITNLSSIIQNINKKYLENVKI